MNYKVENFETYPFAYMRRTGSYGIENYVLMENFKIWLENNSLLNEKTVIYAVARDNIESIPPELCRYDVGIICDKEFNSIELNIGELDSGTYLVFEIEHTSEAIKSFWNSCFNILLEENYSFDDSRLILERYDTRLIKIGLCEFCIPIK